jgi:hypothetical protein
MILAFLFSTPGRESSIDPAVFGQILLGDIVLLGAALSTAGEALVASELDDDDRKRIKPA